MLIIVYGHAPAGTKWFNTAPINPKQLGVTLFVFATSFCLVRERRSLFDAITPRLLYVYFVGIFFALAWSLYYGIVRHDIGESNYLPFIFGINVLVNYFPANPSTWYIGTYLHLLLLWWVWLHRVHVRFIHLAIIAAVSIGVRSVLIASGDDFIAYMNICNWLPIFMLGMYASQTKAESKRNYVIPAILFLSFCAAWPSITLGLNVQQDFPFKRLEIASPIVGIIATSFAIEAIYLGVTWLIFRLSTALPNVEMVNFFARNTLFIFVSHMFLRSIVSPYLDEIVESGALRVAINILIYFFGLGLLGELFQRTLKLKSLTNGSAQWIGQTLGINHQSTCDRKPISH